MASITEMDRNITAAYQKINFRKMVFESVVNSVFLETADEEETTKFLSWKQEVQKANPGKRLLFKGRIEKGAKGDLNTVSAEESGKDRSYGVWDHDEKKGHLFTESDESGYSSFLQTKQGDAPVPIEPENVASDPVDTISMEVPFLIRAMEYAREDAKTDESLHVATEKMIKFSKAGPLTMAAYDEIFGVDHAGPDGDGDADDKTEMSEATREHQNWEVKSAVWKDEGGYRKPTDVKTHSVRSDRAYRAVQKAEKQYEPGRETWSVHALGNVAEGVGDKEEVAEGFSDTDTVFLTPPTGKLAHLRYNLFSEGSPEDHAAAIKYHSKDADRATSQKSAFHDMRAKMHSDWLDGRQVTSEGYGEDDGIFMGAKVYHRDHQSGEPFKVVKIVDDQRVGVVDDHGNTTDLFINQLVPAKTAGDKELEEAYSYPDAKVSLIADPEERARINDLKSLYSTFGGVKGIKRARHFDKTGLLKATAKQKDLLFRMTDETGNVKPKQDTVTESKGSTEPLSVGDNVTLRNPNSSLYGASGKVDRIDGDQVYVSGKNMMTLPHDRKHVQLVSKPLAVVESLTANDSIDKWIGDFIASKDPKFEGKSKEDRRKMAVGAFYGAKK